MARIYHIIGDVYGRQQQFPACIDYFNKALDLYRKDSNLMMAGQVYSDFGLLYQLQYKYDSALLYYKMALRVGDSTWDLKNIATYNTDIRQCVPPAKEPPRSSALAPQSIGICPTTGKQLTAGHWSTPALPTCTRRQKTMPKGVRAGELSRQYAELNMIPLL